mmetsp:Transcript_8912/g.12326  ORF Transcript_8912/g.12326 Transcript_8912/m.12326 type:complete len:157 (-) Transcript_8912:239-709(-)|eukprot:CAMPEP_0185738572 /NCGR_PEP_ID=MMETSP1171-20130828/33317_1 /TAXON_ID=374046 /ORGANISM="Helicotheca tamensis, Strain CCMP826" /LENGTH=156 /DNA_ID=CAMNT_0028409857 /DNA_START=42 /DNA_END=512 /DNA_ORIENTATION=+
MDPLHDRTDAVHRADEIRGRNNTAVSLDNLPKNVVANFAKTRLGDDVGNSLVQTEGVSQTQGRISPVRRNELRNKTTAPRSTSAESSSPSEDYETEEQMQESYNADMTMIKSLRDTLLKLKKINDELKNDNKELSNEVKHLKVEMEELIETENRLS